VRLQHAKAIVFRQIKPITEGGFGVAVLRSATSIFNYNLKVFFGISPRESVIKVHNLKAPPLSKWTRKEGLLGKVTLKYGVAFILGE